MTASASFSLHLRRLLPPTAPLRACPHVLQPRLACTSPSTLPPPPLPSAGNHPPPPCRCRHPLQLDDVEDAQRFRHSGCVRQGEAHPARTANAARSPYPRKRPAATLPAPNLTPTPSNAQVHGSRNNISQARALFNALQRMTSAQDVADRRGKRVLDMTPRSSIGQAGFRPD